MKKKILIVDDEKQIARMLKIRMEASGYEADVANDGLEGLAKVQQSQPDLIILDVMMPKMDGFEVCRKLKDDPVFKSIPVLMLSVKAEEKATDLGVIAGADDYMPKPFEPEILMEKIRKLLK
ncbi:MAG: response regulator [bacterium]|nr:response regulator [bacterium]